MRNIIYFIIFLTSFNSSYSQVKPEKNNEEEILITFIEDIPVYPGCEEVNKDYRMNCFNLKIQQHFKKHFKYPKKALKKGISGRVMISFIINREGNIENITTTGAPEILMNEAKRIVSLLPKFKPGYLNGELVRVQYSMPLTFRLR